MEREEIRARLMDLADGVLSAEEARRLEAEVRRHPDLAHELEALREAIRLAGRLRETALPEGLSASIRAAIDATVRPRSVRAIPLWLAGSAAAAVLALVVGYLLLVRADSPASGDRTVLSRADREAGDKVRESGAIRPAETWRAKEDARGEPELAEELAEKATSLDLLKRSEKSLAGAPPAAPEDAAAPRLAGKGSARRAGLAAPAQDKVGAGEEPPAPEREARDAEDGRSLERKAGVALGSQRRAAPAEGQDAPAGAAKKRVPETETRARKLYRGGAGPARPKTRSERLEDPAPPPPSSVLHVALDVEAPRLDAAREALVRFLQQNGVVVRPVPAAPLRQERADPRSRLEEDGGDRTGERGIQILLTEEQASRLEGLLRQFGSVTSSLAPAARPAEHAGLPAHPAAAGAPRAPVEDGKPAPPLGGAVPAELPPREPARGGDAAGEARERERQKSSAELRREEAKDADGGTGGLARTPARAPKLRTWILVLRPR